MSAWTELQTILDKESVDVRRAQAGAWFERWIATVEVREHMDKAVYEQAINKGVLKELVEEKAASQVARLLLREPAIHYPGASGLYGKPLAEIDGAYVFRYRLEVVRQRPRS